VNGYLDDIPTSDVSRFLEELREHVRTEGTIVKEIRGSGDLSEEVEKRLAEEIDRYTKRFAVTEEAPAAA
jgi:F-type H+/Na+-transporting ATPase subunit alpha